MYKNTRSYFFRVLAAAAFVLGAFVAGCEGDHHSSSGGSSNITGSWRLSSADGSPWYIHFEKNGNWKITDDADGTVRRVYGTYTCNGSRFSGPMVNPGVGDGKIEGTVNGDSMTLDFIEYWHSPAKHVPYTGTRY